MNSAQSLLALQSTDQALAALRRANRKVAQELEAQGGLPELKEKVEKVRMRELEVRVEHAKMESELATLKERLTHLEERLYSGAITNVKELQAVESEHAAARRQYVSLEQGLGPALAAAQDARARHDELRLQLTQAEEEWDQSVAELNTRRKKLSNEMSAVSKKRVNEATGIPAGDLSFYESLLTRKAGVAVVKVERGVCQGCRVRLPARELSQVRLSEGLVSCSTCGRILLP